MPTTKKRSTKTAATNTDAEDLGRLAHHISEALRIMRKSPLVPVRVFNDFADAVNNLYNLANDDDLVHSEAYIRLHLARLAEMGGAE